MSIAYFLAVTLVCQVLKVRTTENNDQQSSLLTLDKGNNCVHFVVNASNYDMSDDGQLKLKGSNIVVDANDYTVSLDDRTAHGCYPISDYLKQCVNKSHINREQYAVQRHNMMLTNALSGQKYPLGTYYLTSGGSVAVICGDKHHAYAERRSKRTCNYILLSPGEYKIDENGRLHLFSSDELLPIANYTLDPVTNMVNACYPLTQDFLNCSSWWILEKREIEILPDKELLSKPHQKTYGRGDYFLIEGNRAVTCTQDDSPDVQLDVYILQAVANILSAVCLAAAIVVHLLLPDLSYQRAPLLCHAISLLITYVCLATRQLGTPTYEGNCYLLFYFTYYFSTSAFCWLSVLAFDLWRISCSLRTGTEPYAWVNHFRNTKFLSYAAVGWGIPVLLTLIVVLVDYYEHIQNTLGLYPYIAAMCWFNERPSAFIFFYGPISALLAINFFLFGFTVHNIWFASRHVEFTNKKLNKQLLVICFVVFLAMGLFWIMEIVSYGDGRMWTVPDLINALQGVVVAAVYTCRPLTWRLLTEKFSGFRSKVFPSGAPSVT